MSTSAFKSVHEFDLQCTYANSYSVLKILLHVLSGEEKIINANNRYILCYLRKKNCVKYLEKLFADADANRRKRTFLDFLVVILINMKLLPIELL